MFDSHVEVFVRRANVAFLEGLDTLRQIDLRDLREVGRSSVDPDAQLGIVLLAPGRIGEHVDCFGQRLKLPLGFTLVGALHPVGMVFPSELAETVSNLLF